jgi:hypothetical protein
VFLLTSATLALSLITMWDLIGATPRDQPWTPAVTLPQGRNGLSARRMAVWWTFRAPSLGRHVHRELMRSAVLDLTPIISATTCHQRNYVPRYSRFNRQQVHTVIQAACPDDELSQKRWQQITDYIRRLESALEQVATGEIVGQPNNYRDSLQICRDIAKEALK